MHKIRHPIRICRKRGAPRCQAIPIGLYRNNRLYAIHADHLNTPRRIVDDSNKVVWQWPYSAFGDNKPSGILKTTTTPNNAVTQDATTTALLRATTPTLKFNLRYPGQYFDEESNLNYNYQRSDQFGQGRYSQSDPIGLDGGWNRFGYVGADALSFTDPLGLQGFPVPRGTYLPRGSVIPSPPNMATNNGVGTTQSIMNQFTNLPNPSPVLPGAYPSINFPWTLPNIKRICVRCATQPENICNRYSSITVAPNLNTCQCKEWKYVVINL